MAEVPEVEDPLEALWFSPAMSEEFCQENLPVDYVKPRHLGRELGGGDSIDPLSPDERVVIRPHGQDSKNFLHFSGDSAQKYRNGYDFCKIWRSGRTK